MNSELHEIMKERRHAEKSKCIPFRMLLAATIIVTIPVILNVLMYAPIKVEAQSPNIDASNVYETKSMSLGNDIKNLVILIPNEAHESQNIADFTSEQRHINQPYVPWHLTVSEGTAIVWFNGDVGHDRKISLIRQDGVPGSDGSSNLYFDSGTFDYNTTTSQVVMNDTGSFYYFESDVNNEDPDFVMNGTINVVDQSSSASTTTTTTTMNDTVTGLPDTSLDTIGTLMVPTEDLESYTSDLENGGLPVLSSHNFDDIRSDDQQTLIVWGASSSGTDSLESIFSQIEEITPTLPYS